MSPSKSRVLSLAPSLFIAFLGAASSLTAPRTVGGGGVPRHEADQYHTRRSRRPLERTAARGLRDVGRLRGQLGGGPAHGTGLVRSTAADFFLFVPVRLPESVLLPVSPAPIPSSIRSCRLATAYIHQPYRFVALQVEYLRAAAEQAGLEARHLFIESLLWNGTEFIEPATSAAILELLGLSDFVPLGLLVRLPASESIYFSPFARWSC